MSSLQPLYDVKERLEYAAIAGTGLLGEDFRLRRSAEAMRPLAAAGPVFGKISAGLDQLLAAPGDQRPALLLDVLGLVDAVAYTQGTCGLAGDMGDLPVGGGTYHQISYSQILPLLTALTTTGGGRLEVIRANWESHPEYFSDFRVLPALVNDLGDSFGEIGEFISKILKSLGPAVLPALKAGFDPKGKKDMVRRVQIMENIAGSGANDFYLSHIPEAEKDVRAALIYALRHDEGNVEKLIELSGTEKGSAKKMALWALARMDCPAVRDYWLRSEKTKTLALQYAAHSTTAASSAAVAEALDRWLAPYEADVNAPLDLKGKESLEALLCALPGKSGPEICDIYRRMAALGAALDNKAYSNTNGQSMALRVRPAGFNGWSWVAPFSQAASRVLRWSILFHPTPDLVDLAVELYEKDPAYASAAITAVLLTKSAGEAFGLSGLCESANPLSRLLHNKPKAETLHDAFCDLIWDKEYGRTAYHIMFSDPANGWTVELVRPVAEPMDRRWYKALTTLGGTEAALDWRLAHLVPLDDPELCYQVGEYLYKRFLKGIGISNLRELRRLGWQKGEGLIVALCKSKKVTIWELCSFFRDVPGDAETRHKEALQVLEMAKRGKVSFASTWKPESLVAQLEKDIERIFGGLSAAKGQS